MTATVAGYEIAVVLFALVMLGIMAGTALLALAGRWREPTRGTQSSDDD